MPCSRRRFMLVAASLASTSFAVDTAHADAQPVTATDPTAQALGYTPDASKADKAKFPKYQSGQMCASCQLFQGKAGDASGPCQIFGGKIVNAKGWCSAYVKKA